MDDRVTTAKTDACALIADRYQVEATLGQGGMAAVYQVLDTKTKKKLALKQMAAKADDRKREEFTRLFEHEFHTLAQLAHPRVIEVYDYGIDKGGPYYTMELLDGGDLSELSPLPWKEACSIMRDVCSALGLLHSRRQVHRDLTPRNIRCTRDGKAKLIDFGAMVPMGPCKQLVGTPSFTAPEAVALQSLDARADLYSLGASLYYALTGRNAYHARTFEELRELWRSRPRPPSSFVPDIPKELDSLVMSLINLDVMARPVNAAEVMEKLSAVAGLEPDEQLVASQAYLSAPVLAGREEPLLSVRNRIVKALGGHGSAILIEGDSGVGRSRFLDACVLEGKISGAVVLRADASDARAGAWGGVKALALQLMDALPEVAWDAVKPHVRVLGNVLPEVLERFGDGKKPSFKPSLSPRALQELSEKKSIKSDPSAEVWGRGYSLRPSPPGGAPSIPAESFTDPLEVRPRAQAALRDWLLQVARQRCVMVAVDDLNRMDEPSAAFVALLSHEVSNQMLVVAATAETDAPATSAAALKLLREAGAGVKLRNLAQAHVEEMLGSVFGETPNLKLLADRLFAISRGNPRAVMQLAQHLVDKGLIRYQSGAWTLPADIDVGDLPGSLGEALKARMHKLGADSLKLARTLALSPERSFSFDECLFLAGHGDTVALIRNLNELIAAEMLETDGEYYWFSQRGWAPVLLEELEESNMRALHLRLAELFEKQGSKDFWLARHLLNAGEEDRALSAFVYFAETSMELTVRSPQAFSELLQSLPIDWYDTFTSVIRLGQKKGRPRKHIYSLQSRLSGIVSVTGTGDTAHLTELIQQLISDSGLGCYHELGASVEEPDRLWRALELAQQRYEACPESERVLAPTEAIRELAKALIEAAAIISTSYDFSFWQSLPSLEPLIPLSPALGVVEKLVQAIGARITARYEQACRQYKEILERTAEEDRAGLEETHHKYMRLGIMRGIGMMEAAMGLGSALKWALEIESDPLHQVNAWRIRMAYNIWQGTTREAEQCKRRVELLQIQQSPTQFFEGSHFSREVVAYALADDLLGVKQTFEGLEKMAERFRDWAPTLHYAKAEYQRIRGDYPSALAELQEALKLAAPGRNQNWADIAGAYLRTLLAMGRDRQAEATGQEFLVNAEREDLGYAGNYVRMPLAEAEAKVGYFENAVKDSETAVDRWRALGATGLNLGLAYESRARVAILMNDNPSFATYAGLCAEQYQAGRNPALTAKYERLMQEARQRNLGVSEDLARAADFSGLSAGTVFGLVSTMLSDCRGTQERAERALKLLVTQSNCSGGFLYTIQRQGPVLAARSGDRPPPLNMDTIVKDYLVTEMSSGDKTIAHDVEPGDAPKGIFNWVNQSEERYCPLLLAHNAQEGFVITGLAILLLSPGKTFSFPVETVAAISKSLLDAGDVVTVYT